MSTMRLESLLSRLPLRAYWKSGLCDVWTWPLIAKSRLSQRIRDDQKLWTLDIRTRMREPDSRKGRKIPPPAIRPSDDIISQYPVTVYSRRTQPPAKQHKLQFPLSSTRGVDIADITTLGGSATWLKYLPFPQIPDLSVFIVNCVLWCWAIDVLVSLHYYYPASTRSWETDRRCVHFTHTQSVRSPHFYTPKCKLLFGRQRWR